MHWSFRAELKNLGGIVLHRLQRVMLIVLARSLGKFVMDMRGINAQNDLSVSACVTWMALSLRGL